MNVARPAGWSVVSAAALMSTPMFRVRSLLRARRERPRCRTADGYIDRILKGEKPAEALSLYLPRRVVRDVHRSIAAGTSQCRH
jgi:hypothetical protein